MPLREWQYHLIINTLLFPCFSAKASFSHGCRLMLPRKYELCCHCVTGLLVLLISGCNSEMQHYSQEPEIHPDSSERLWIVKHEITVLNL